METQSLIVAQIGADVIMVALLLWFMRSHAKARTSWQDYEKVIEKSEAVLGEMGKISRVLERNLEEKKVLSREILTQLDQGLKRAEENYRQISGIIPQAANAFGGDRVSIKDTRGTRASVQALLEKGLSKEEIARHLGISVGEIDLLVKLRPRQQTG